MNNKINQFLPIHASKNFRLNYILSSLFVADWPKWVFDTFEACVQLVVEANSLFVWNNTGWVTELPRKAQAEQIDY